eukprot:Em0021g4a
MIHLQRLFKRLQVDPSYGHTNDQVERLLHLYGPNSLSPPITLPVVLKFAKHLVGGFSLLLLAASALLFVSYVVQYVDDSIQDTAVNIRQYPVLSDTSKPRSEKFMKAFEVPVEVRIEHYKHVYLQVSCLQKTMVLRGRMRRDINIDRLVVGDIVDVKFGDKIPADIRIITCSGFKVDNSLFTGESEPRPRYGDSEDPDPLESKNLAFFHCATAFSNAELCLHVDTSMILICICEFATDAVEGVCTGVVLRTGDRTMIGHFAQLTGTVNAEITIGVIFFILAVATGPSFINALIHFIGIIAANVPEGLLPTLTPIFGTMVLYMCMEYAALSTQTRLDRMFLHPESLQPQSKGWEALSMVIGLCSNATFKDNQGHIKVMDRKCNGDCSESALLKFYELEVGSVIESRDLHTKVFEIPFNSSNKPFNSSNKPFNSSNKPKYALQAYNAIQVSIHEWDDESYVLIIKGAPETVIKLCSSFLDRQGKVCLFAYNVDKMPNTPIGLLEECMDTSFSEHFTSAHDLLASQGERVLAFAYKHLDQRSYPRGYVFDPEKADELLQGLCFAGLVSLFDPPRGNVSEAIAKCRMAGIKVYSA